MSTDSQQLFKLETIHPMNIQEEKAEVTRLVRSLSSKCKLKRIRGNEPDRETRQCRLTESVLLANRTETQPLSN